MKKRSGIRYNDGIGLISKPFTIRNFCNRDFHHETVKPRRYSTPHEYSLTFRACRRNFRANLSRVDFLARLPSGNACSHFLPCVKTLKSANIFYLSSTTAILMTKLDIWYVRKMPNKKFYRLVVEFRTERLAFSLILIDSSTYFFFQICNPIFSNIGFAISQPKCKMATG